MCTWEFDERNISSALKLRNSAARGRRQHSQSQRQQHRLCVEMLHEANNQKLIYEFRIRRIGSVTGGNFQFMARVNDTFL